MRPEPTLASTPTSAGISAPVGDTSGVGGAKAAPEKVGLGPAALAAATTDGGTGTTEAPSGPTGFSTAVLDVAARRSASPAPSSGA